MSIQFVDMRISQDSAMDTPELTLPAAATPYTFGDIGIQTTQVASGNEGLVRVTLNAYARIRLEAAIGTMTDDVAFNIFRNGTSIFSTVFPGSLSTTDPTYELGGITAVDFPPAADVLAGQIQYTAVVTTNRSVTLGARCFSGIAVAGNS